jgi:hypothetical protein
MALSRTKQAFTGLQSLLGLFDVYRHQYGENDRYLKMLFLLQLFIPL